MSFGSLCGGCLNRISRVVISTYPPLIIDIFRRRRECFSGKAFHLIVNQLFFRQLLSIDIAQRRTSRAKGKRRREKFRKHFQFSQETPNFSSAREIPFPVRHAGDATKNKSSLKLGIYRARLSRKSRKTPPANNVCSCHSNYF